MKRAILAPVFSGLVLPGTGQILNRQYIKGMAFIGVVTVLFVLILLKLLIDLNKALQTIADAELDAGFRKALAAAMVEQDHTFLVLFLAILAFVWGFSVVDAYRHGKRLDTMSHAPSDV